MSRADRFALLAFGLTMGPSASWFTWRLWSCGEVLIALGVSTLALMGALATWTGARGR